MCGCVEGEQCGCVERVGTRYVSVEGMCVCACLRVCECVHLEGFPM